MDCDRIKKGLILMEWPEKTSLGWLLWEEKWKIKKKEPGMKSNCVKTISGSRNSNCKVTEAEMTLVYLRDGKNARVSRRQWARGKVLRVEVGEWKPCFVLWQKLDLNWNGSRHCGRLQAGKDTFREGKLGPWACPCPHCFKLSCSAPRLCMPLGVLDGQTMFLLFSPLARKARSMLLRRDL